MEAATISLEEEALKSIGIYPNPANEVIKWQSSDEISAVALYDMLGREVQTNSAEAGEINTSGLDNGMYLLKFTSVSGMIRTQKIQVQH